MNDKPSKTICLPFANEADYREIVADKQSFREYLLNSYQENPELLPEAFKEGFNLHGFVTSKKQDFTIRRIRLNKDREAYQIRPSFMMPYMIARTEEGIWKNLWGT